MNGIKISALDSGTNIYQMSLPAGTDVKKLTDHLASKYYIRIIPRADEKRNVQITVNETLLYRDTKYIEDAFKNAIRIAVG